jgi:23S rRNA (guanosine2251-2'-O)-methyltransferase
MSKTKLQDAHQIYGINGSLAFLESKKFNIRSIDILDNGIASNNQQIRELLKNRLVTINNIPQETFRKKYEKKHTQGIVITFIGTIEKDLPRLKSIEGNFCLLIIDNITDPQNLGQIIRTAECGGIDGIIIPNRNSVRITDTVLQVSQGAFCNIPIYTITNLHQTIMQLKEDDFWTIALENSIDAKPWYDIDYKGKIAMVVGSEGYGIKPIVLKSCDFYATIPMQGKTNSLNVSASVSAIVFERLRQVL